jgi:hypothetical protein
MHLPLLSRRTLPRLLAPAGDHKADAAGPGRQHVDDRQCLDQERRQKEHVEAEQSGREHHRDEIEHFVDD